MIVRERQTVWARLPPPTAHERRAARHDREGAPWAPDEEHVVTFKNRRPRIAALSTAALVAVVALVAAGCGGSAVTPATPTPTPSQSSLAARLLALKDYLGQVKPVADQIGSTVASLPGAVKSMSAKPGATWTAAATALDAAATQLGAEAASLSAIAPPAALQPTQDAAVKAIQSVQTGVSDTAAFLNKKVATAGTTKASIEAKLAAAQAQLSAAALKLTSAIQGLILSPDSTPAP
jgi:hypothetical protein